MVLSLDVLGEFVIRDENGAARVLPARKTRALLGFLAANADKPQRRERLMSLLWSDRAERQARHSLNQALTSIRQLGKSAGAPLLDSDGERVTLRRDTIDIDLVRFMTLRDEDPAEAAALYTGPFLEGLAIPDPAFEEWVAAMRMELDELARETLEKAADVSVSRADPRKATGFARRLITLDPLREDGYRRLMRLLYESGDRAGALRQYQSCADILRQELQVEPDGATKALFDQIRNDTRSENLPIAAPGAAHSGSSKTPPSLPNIPSIAVLPFDNLGGDPAQDFFGDGIAEDIITELSRFRSLFVIARGSSFSFKGQLIDTRRIAGELGVRYVLEGSVRVHGRRVRINAQLIDAENGHHVWSERYDRDSEDILTLQDQITRSIAGIIEPAIGVRERERMRLQGARQLDAWALFQSGLAHYYSHTKKDLDDAAAFFTMATEADPNFAAAHAMLADSLVRSWIYFRREDRSEVLASAQISAETAMRLDPHDARGPLTLGRVHTLLGNDDAAITLVNRALELNPNQAMAHYARGFILVNSEPSQERLEESLHAFDQAVRLSPNDPFITAFMSVRARVLLQLERYEEAADSAQVACRSPNPRPWAFAFLAIALNQLGRSAASEAALEELKRRFPDFNVTFAREMEHWPVVWQRHFESLLRSAGVPA